MALSKLAFVHIYSNGGASCTVIMRSAMQKGSVKRTALLPVPIITFRAL